MIFAAKNEKGEPSWKLVLDGRKIITRRLKSTTVGKIRAVQPGRGKKSICKIKILRCMPHKNYMIGLSNLSDDAVGRFQKALDNEAKKEGFETWQGLLDWLNTKGIDIGDTWRLEFEKVIEK